MLLNTNNDKQITNIDSDAFTVSNSSAIFTLMTDKLYSDKPLAALRETLSNAIDATQASLKIGQTPEKATLVAAVNGTGFDVTVTDNGIGMTAKTIKTVYSDLFTSTKSSDNSQTGGFGIGALAIFAVADKFTITTRHESDKKASVYVVHKDETGLPQISKIAETTSQRGTTVSFYMPSIPMLTAKTITLTAFFNREYCASNIDLRGGYSSKITGLHGATGAANIQKITMQGKDFHINEIAHNVFATGKTLSDLAYSHYYSTSDNTPLYVVMGSNIITKATPHSPQCYAIASIGDISLTPNREQFEKTVKNDAALGKLPRCPKNKAAYDLGPTDFKSFMYDCNPKIYGSAVISIASSAVSATNECKAFKSQSYSSYTDTIEHLNIYAIPIGVKYDDCDYPKNCYTMRMNRNASTSKIIYAIKKALVEHSEHLHAVKVTINTQNMGLKPKKKSTKTTRETPFLYPDEPKPNLNRETVFVTKYNIDYQDARIKLDKLKKQYPDEFGAINPVIRADSYTGPNNIVNSIREILMNMTPENRARAYVFDERQFATVAIEALNFDHDPRLYGVINRATDEIFLDADDISHRAKKAYNQYVREELKKPTNEMFNGFFKPKNKFHTTKPNKTVIRSALIAK